MIFLKGITDQLVCHTCMSHLILSGALPLDIYRKNIKENTKFEDTFYIRRKPDERPLQTIFFEFLSRISNICLYMPNYPCKRTPEKHYKIQKQNHKH